MDPNFVLLLQLLLLLWPAATSATSNSSILAMPGCQDSCGGVTIPYPFGIGAADCYRQGFELSCLGGGPDSYEVLVTLDGKATVVDISLQGQLRISPFFIEECYDISAATSGFDFIMSNSTTVFNYSVEGPFTFSDTENRFTAVGCDTIASISDVVSNNFSSGCSLACTSQNVVTNGSCSIGCCQTFIPKGYKAFTITVTSKYNHKFVSSFNPCGYAFLTDYHSLNFSIASILANHSTDTLGNLSVVLDWAIEVNTPENVQYLCDQNQAGYACGNNTDCYASKNGLGYSCNCSLGYQGNPYLSNGCQEINECEDPNNNNCSSNSICTNRGGSYSCSCPHGFHGDGRKDGKGCVKSILIVPVAIASILGGLGLMSFVLFGSTTLYKVLKKRRRNKLKQKFFLRNGGFLLQQQISSERGNLDQTKIFSEEELQKATDNYNENRILGHGGQGTVYKGMLSDGRIVAIKKSKGIHDEGQIEPFINEVVLLSQINHRNVVKLFGCCLEAEVPLLVYEFISNGTLFSHIHDKSDEFSFTWDNRLRIATEIAGALGYLHSEASIPIYHRDIKSTNILLDDRYRAKVSDFGISRSVSIDKTHLTTSVQGTFGYLDPEYFQTSKFTDKSDVYSFGVVLVELLTREKPISSTRSQENKSLVAYFISSMETNNLFEILDAQVVEEGKKEELETVAALAHRCLNIDGKKRPTMKQITMELEGLRASPPENLFIHEIEQGEQGEDYFITERIGLWDTCSVSTASLTMRTDAIFPLDDQPLLFPSS